MFLPGEDEDVMVVDEPVLSRKRKAEETQQELQTDEKPSFKVVKRAKVSDEPEQREDDIVVL